MPLCMPYYNVRARDETTDVLFDVSAAHGGAHVGYQVEILFDTLLRPCSSVIVPER